MSGKPRILLMDDDRLIRQICNDILANVCEEVFLTENPLQAVRAYRQRLGSEQCFQMAILDLMNPMGGNEAGLFTFRALREIDSEVKAILISGKPDAPAFERALEYGFKGRLPKPFTSQNLLALLAVLSSQ